VSAEATPALSPEQEGLVREAAFALFLLDDSKRIHGPALEADDLAEFMPRFRPIADLVFLRPERLREVSVEHCAGLSAALQRLSADVINRMCERDGCPPLINTTVH
jgi:hypothetical protein